MTRMSYEDQVRNIGIGEKDLRRMANEDAWVSNRVMVIGMGLIIAMLSYFIYHQYGLRSEEVPQMQADLSERRDFLQLKEPKVSVPDLHPVQK